MTTTTLRVHGLDCADEATPLRDALQSRVGESSDETLRVHMKQLMTPAMNRIPLPDACAATVIVERTPLSHTALREIVRVTVPGGNIILRHARPPWSDPHHWALVDLRALAGLTRRIKQGVRRLDQQMVQETRIRLMDSARAGTETATNASPVLAEPQGLATSHDEIAGSLSKPRRDTKGRFS